MRSSWVCFLRPLLYQLGHTEQLDLPDFKRDLPNRFDARLLYADDGEAGSAQHVDIQSGLALVGVLLDGAAELGEVAGGGGLGWHDEWVMWGRRLGDGLRMSRGHNGAGAGVGVGRIVEKLHDGRSIVAGGPGAVVVGGQFQAGRGDSEVVAGAFGKGIAAHGAASGGKKTSCARTAVAMLLTTAQAHERERPLVQRWKKYCPPAPAPA